MIPKNTHESRQVAKVLRITKKKCFYNAFRTLTELVEYNDAIYVEGIIFITAWGLRVEHGWVERNGEIIDPTLPDKEVVYFPGLKFNGIAGLSKAIKEIPKPDDDDDDLPLFIRFGWGGCDSAEMNKAREQADAYFKSRLVVHAKPQ